MKRIAGREGVYFNNAVFLSERETADRNYSMAYFMKENKCFPPSGDLYEIMDMYFQTCSMEINTEALSVMGATLANGGTYVIYTLELDNTFWDDMCLRCTHF